MGIEIERKFLVTDDSWRSDAKGQLCRQGYLSISSEIAVRVRIMGEQASLTVKGMGAAVTRPEFEYPLPLADANEMLDRFCLKPVVEKIRYHVNYSGNVWEVDEFLGDNKGLVLAEIELENENQVIELPEWTGEEVTEDDRYIKINLGLLSYHSLME